MTNLVAEMGWLSLEASGRLLADISTLQTLSAQLPWRQRKWFSEDLRDLQSERAHIAQKLATIQRMYHSHAFLQPHLQK